MKKSSLAGFLFYGILFVGISCKKQHFPTPPPPEQQFNVINTGIIHNPQKDFYEPFYWVNDKKYPLAMGNTTEAFPYGLDEHNNDMLIVGGYLDPVSGLLMPCYWKNGAKIDLPVNELMINQRCSANDVKWFNNSWYIIGDADFWPVIWKIKGSDVSIIKVNGTTGKTLQMLKGANLEKHNNRLYFACNQAIEKGDGTMFFEAGYWTVNSNDELNYHVVETDLYYALCFGMAISDKGIFIVGEFANTNTTYYTPVIWTSQGHLDVINQINRNKQRLSEVILDGEGIPYVIILDYQVYKPTIWKLTTPTAYEPIMPEVPVAAKGFCRNLAIAGDKIAASFTYELDNKYYAGYSFNEEQVMLEADSNNFISLYRTQIFKK